MAVSASVLRVSTTLRLGERVVVRCEDGLLATEYVLFDPTDIVLRATDPVSVRESGYITTARDALARLARTGITPALAANAAKSLRPEVVASYARAGAVANVAAAADLGACELFDGAVYRASAQCYEGAWLDLRALAAGLQHAGAAAVLQALYLAAALDEVPRSTPLHLATSNATRDRRPGERTHRRVDLEGFERVVESLKDLPPCADRVEPDPQRARLVRDGLIARVRDRALPDAAPRLQTHLTALEAALTAEGRARGPLSDPALWAIEQQLAAGDTHGVRERLDELEHQRGPTPALRYLRARTAFVGGDEPPSSAAQALSAIANEEAGFHEAELVAARAWLAAGEDEYARHFARRLAEDGTARDSERLVALEILDATSAESRSRPPPPAREKSPSASPAVAAAPLPPPFASPTPQSPMARAPQLPGPPAVPAISPAPSPASGQSSGAARTVHEGAGMTNAMGALIPAMPSVAVGASLPPMATIPPPAIPASVPPLPPVTSGQLARPVGRSSIAPLHYDPELVESLALPMGATEDVLAVGDWPTSPIQARTAMTRLARSLARDYRLWYGSTLRCNVLAVDAMQRHLSQRYAGATLSEAKVVLELQRHGALLSEIMARTLGAEWVDIAPSEPGYWAMNVPPKTRCWPIGRVYRFVSLGHRERDLVSYFLEIEARTKS